MPLTASSPGSEHSSIILAVKGLLSRAHLPRGSIVHRMLGGGKVWRSLAHLLYNQRNTKKKQAHTHTHTQQDEPLPPYPQRLCPPSPWHHPPWTQIAASPLPPHEFAQALGARVQARHRLLPCMGRQNGTHREIERGGMHRPWMAASHWVNSTIKRTMALAARGGLGRRSRWAERVGCGVYSSVGRRFEAPIKKMRGGCPGLRWTPIDGKTQQPTESRFRH
jgi:hypothetical protein